MAPAQAVRLAAQRPLWATDTWMNRLHRGLQSPAMQEGLNTSQRAAIATAAAQSLTLWQVSLCNKLVDTLEVSPMQRRGGGERSCRGFEVRCLPEQSVWQMHCCSHIARHMHPIAVAKSAVDILSSYFVGCPRLWLCRFSNTLPRNFKSTTSDIVGMICSDWLCFALFFHASEQCTHTRARVHACVRVCSIAVYIAMKALTIFMLLCFSSYHVTLLVQHVTSRNECIMRWWLWLCGGRGRPGRGRRARCTRWCSFW